MESVGVVPGVEYTASLVDHGQVWEKILLVGKVFILHGLVEPFNSSILLGAIRIREVMGYPCVFQFPVKMQEIFTSIVCVDGSNGKRKVGSQLLHKVSCRG